MYIVIIDTWHQGLFFAILFLMDLRDLGFPQSTWPVLIIEATCIYNSADLWPGIKTPLLKRVRHHKPESASRKVLVPLWACSPNFEFCNYCAPPCVLKTGK